ncbi:MAG: hypothetical protein GX808_13740 [Syntrophomonadaceae bacterium]|jgi:protein arginine kinase activator|nr:hypothetical protein [Syntrophomonadaceae bacterium]
MYCEECNKKPATVHLTQMFNGQKKETHLCESCAAKKGAVMLNFDGQFGIPSLLGSFFGSHYNVKNINTTAEHVICPNCGMKFIDIRQTGKLGCAECYQAFNKDIEPILRRIHGSSRHTGKIPARGGEAVLLKKKIEALKIQLHEAVVHEEYEKAAEIRDSIKDLEKQME